jgi:hypothetical protein
VADESLALPVRMNQQKRRICCSDERRNTE